MKDALTGWSHRRSPGRSPGKWNEKQSHGSRCTPRGVKNAWNEPWTNQSAWTRGLSLSSLFSLSLLSPCFQLQGWTFSRLTCHLNLALLLKIFEISKISIMAALGSVVISAVLGLQEMVGFVRLCLKSPKFWGRVFSSNLSVQMMQTLV